MDRSRLTAFTDGVVTVLITIMVLNMNPPHGARLENLRVLWPIFLSYILSYIHVAIYWNNHHHFFHLVKVIDGAILWANLNLLFWLSLVPLAAAWMGENGFASISTAMYGVALLMSAAAWSLMQAVIIRQQGADSPLRRVIGRDPKTKLTPMLYMLGVVFACFSPSVHQQARRRVETRHHTGRLNPVEAPVSDEPPDHRAVLLLHESLIVLLVGT
jgi:uncharacterized membrane protein